MKILFLTFLLLFSSCGSDTEDLIDLAVESANTLLTSGDCQGAINELEAIGRQEKHASYIKTLATAYACRAGYSTQTFFETDASKIGASLSGFASFSTSLDMDDPENQSYLDMQEALDLLLYAGGIKTSLDPTMSRRSLVFGSIEGGDINTLIMYLSMVQLGKYLYFYGNADTDGLKGGGGAGNGCLASYTNVTYSGGDVDTDTVLGVLAGTGNVCTATGVAVGSAYLGTQGALNAKRMCQGIVVLNNFLHVMPTVLGAIGGGSLGSIGVLETLFDTAKARMVLNLPASVEFSNILSQAKCEALADVSDPVTNNLEAYFIYLIESLY